MFGWIFVNAMKSISFDKQDMEYQPNQKTDHKKKDCQY